MKSTFRVLFFLKRDKKKKDGRIPVFCRITVNREATRFSMKADVDPGFWDSKIGRASGKTKEIRQINSMLDATQATIYKIYRDLLNSENHVSAEKIKNVFLGTENEKHEFDTLLKLFKKHNDDNEKLIGISKSKDTVQKYQRTYRRLRDFMKYQYNKNDIALKDINHMFITDFENYLRTICSCATNTTAKFIQHFKRIIIIAQNNGWVQADPFANYKIRLEKVDRGYLTEEELMAIIQKKFAIKRLEQVRDIFIFCCFTGLAFVDVFNLRENHIQKSFDGKLWVMKKRKKSNIQSNILLLDIPKMILAKYKDKTPNKRVLPVLSNQKMNSYLKEIADLCGIEKNLTFHLARHTFATTVTLAKGVPIETVSKMLGHTNIKTTQIYARITNSKISHDMQVLSEKLQGMDKMLTL